MSKKKKDKFDLKLDFTDSLKNIEKLSKEAIKELTKLTEDMLNVASDVKKEYDVDSKFDEALSEMSGSITQIHENSPFLDEIFQGDSWKKVIKTDVPPMPNTKTKKEDKNEK